MSASLSQTHLMHRDDPRTQAADRKHGALSHIMYHHTTAVSSSTYAPLSSMAAAPDC